MKRWICVVLSILLVTLSAAYAEVNYTLPEKMDKQLSIGSGLKGSFTLTAEGSHPLVTTLTRFNGTEYQIRGMKNEEETHYYIYREGENETLLDRTELYVTPERIYIRGDLTGDKVYGFSGIGDLMDRISAPEGGNPSFLSAAMKLLQNGENETILKKYTDELEIWVNRFADQTDARPGTDTGTVEMSYTIPAEALREEIRSLLMKATEDPETDELLRTVMNDAQSRIYFNGDLDYFYDAALKAFESDFDIVLSRNFTLKGEAISSSIEFPLNRELYGWNALFLESDGDKTRITLENEDQILTVILDRIPSLDTLQDTNFWLIKRPADNAEEAGEYLAVHGTLTRTEEKSEDADGRFHETTRWELKVERDVSMLAESESTEKYPEIAPVDCALSLHYSSKYPQSSPTTLEITGDLSSRDLSLKLNAAVKTASPWIFSPFDVSGAEDIMDLSNDEKIALLMKLLGSEGQ